MDRTVAEAAAELNVGKSWLYERAARAEVPCQRYGRSLRFTDAQIVAIREQYTQAVITPRRLRRAA